MAIAGAERSPSRHGHRLERRKRRRVVRATTLWLAGIAAWGLLFLALGWLVAAGFYGLLVNA
jgi:fatty acid desaturase